MTTFKVPNKTLTILRKNCLKLLHTNGSRVTYWRLPTYFVWKTFLLENLKAKQIANFKNKKKVFNFGGYSPCGVSLNLESFLVRFKVVGPLLLDSNSSRDDTNPPFHFPIWQLTNKETKRQAISKDQKMR